MLQHIHLIQKRFRQLEKTPKNTIKAGFLCLLVLTTASAVLAVIDMLSPGLYYEMPLLIQSLFTYGFYLWAVLTVGALILDFVFKK